MISETFFIKPVMSYYFVKKSMLLLFYYKTSMSARDITSSPPPPPPPPPSQHNVDDSIGITERQVNIVYRRRGGGVYLEFFSIVW
jgi:hypothetical protein